ncbi:class I SAM-dependent RNA methyltransferase [Amaricoccus solimangrovi]|uniref:Class I SAM-dependent RNA methyltransferase n=1 Tax=Amaricoccus solimangrovi TaxID=2589815 RepID=A0A501X0C9_9RHOB|nr:class I SAM-dependent RNA methyltransferase [Amaricoccus solimangrovi]TPE52086.1 class I SAM-dependent RNA methyltransferase [Amaricoccus solimangrovi]
MTEAGEAPREARVERLNRAGEGVAGGEAALTVPFALPGERVRGLPVDGILVPDEIVEAAPERVTPPCRHFGTCGGCALQHASDAFLARWKRETVEVALARHGLSAPFRPVATSPARSRRRASFAGRRTRKTVALGFHARRSEAVVDIIECPLIRPELLAAKPLLAEFTALGAGRGGTIRLALTSSEGGLDLDVREAKPLDGAGLVAAARLAEAGEFARLSWNGETVALRRPPWQAFGAARVTPPPGGFLQATAEGQAALTGAVLEAAGGARRVADLFSGCGTFSLPLAEGAEVRAVENSAPALAALDRGWREARGLRRVTTERRDLFRRPLTGAELDAFEAVVLDPARAGAEAQSRALAASRVRRVAMVSCDPVTFARDVAILAEGGYRLDWVQVVDQFRWSGHVEIAAALTR